jgi:F0F1-type ATP synthase membrane subunit b/b'
MDLPMSELEAKVERLTKNRDYEREVARMNAKTAEKYRAEVERLRDELERIAGDPARAFSIRERGVLAVQENP